MGKWLTDNSAINVPKKGTEYSPKMGKKGGKVVPLNSEEKDAIRKNLFPEAAEVVLCREDFPWHRDGRKVTAHLPHSSQGLAIDVWGTIQSLRDPSRIGDALASRWGIGTGKPWEFRLERIMPGQLLGEPRPSQIDASMENETSLAFLEGKFTEEDGGFCSQTLPLPPTSSHGGMIQCTGDYSMQVNPVNGVKAPCALSGKDVRYWDFIPRVLSVASDVDHRPCPFRGGWYQWMRNLVACCALGESIGKKGAFIVLYADGPFPMAKKVKTGDWAKFQPLVKEKEVLLVTMSYQELLKVATAAAAAEDVDVLNRLTVWVNGKITSVGENGRSRGL